jgi:hypothetical protein
VTPAAAIERSGSGASGGRPARYGHHRAQVGHHGHEEARVEGRSLGLLIAAVGVLLVVVGLLVAGGGLSWFGRLPGDLRVEGERTRVFVPITSMLLLSVVLSVLLWVVRR